MSRNNMGRTGYNDRANIMTCFETITSCDVDIKLSKYKIYGPIGNRCPCSSMPYQNKVCRLPIGA